MRSEKWDKVEEIFLAALTCEPSERATFLDQACCNDPLLLEAVGGIRPALSKTEKAKAKSDGEEAGAPNKHPNT